MAGRGGGASGRAPGGRAGPGRVEADGWEPRAGRFGGNWAPVADVEKNPAMGWPRLNWWAGGSAISCRKKAKVKRNGDIDSGVPW